jgi:glutamate racemase
MSVLIVDWGIGGLGVRSALRALAPELPIAYLSDAGAPPYGMLSRDVLRARLVSIATQAKAGGAALLVVACNAASSVLDAPLPLPVVGMVEPAVELVRASGCASVGVVGGRRTILSGVYRRRLGALGLDVRQRVAQPLSALIEAGQTSGDEVDALVARLVRPLAGVDALLLACTHYPAARGAFERALPGTRLLDPAEAVARRALASLGDPRARSGEDHFITTGDPDAMRFAAARAFSVRLGSIEVRPPGAFGRP